MKQQFVRTTENKTLFENRKSQRKRVGILGGGFNPVHTGHLIIADQVCHQLDLDEFFLMPSFESPHVDAKKTISAIDRVEMLKLAVEDNEKLSIELSEIAREGTSYTFETMSELIKRNPDTDYYFVIGGDMVDYLPKWHRIDELVQLVQFVGVHRIGAKVESPYPIIWVDVPLIGISSSEIRKKIATNCSVKYFLPDNVLKYIHKNRLYQGEEKNDL